VVPIGDEPIYAECFAKSPLLASGAAFAVFNQRGFKTAAAAFNQAIAAAQNDLIVFCHQDIILPAGWDQLFLKRLEQLTALDPNWGVAGCAGRSRDGHVAAHIYRHDREFQAAAPLPGKVRTLDECLIAFRPSCGLRFDENLLGFFFYAVDICLQAESRGWFNYAIDAPCFHQAKNRTSLPRSFYEAERNIIRKWHSYLPIQTLSGQVAGGSYLAYKRVRNKWEEWLAACGCRKQPWWSDLPRIEPEKLLRGQ
jgi:hypothetical protein